MPTLLLWGTNDPLMKLADAERCTHESPVAGWHWSPNAGICPSLKRRDVFLFQVGNFLDR